MILFVVLRVQINVIVLIFMRQDTNDINRITKYSYSIFIFIVVVLII